MTNEISAAIDMKAWKKETKIYKKAVKFWKPTYSAMLLLLNDAFWDETLVREGRGRWKKIDH